MKLTREFSKETVRRFFGPHSSKEAMQLKREDPSMYAKIREQAQHDGLVGDNNFQSSIAAAQADYKSRHVQQTFSTDALRSRAAFSEAECKEYLRGKGTGNSDNLGQMKAKDPTRYNLFRTAAESYGLVAPRATQPEKEQPKPDNKFLLGEALRTRFRLPDDYRMDSAEFEQLTRLATDLDAEAAAKNNEVAESK